MDQDKGGKKKRKKLRHPRLARFLSGKPGPKGSLASFSRHRAISPQRVPSISQPSSSHASSGAGTVVPDPGFAGSHPEPQANDDHTRQAQTGYTGSTSSSGSCDYGTRQQQQSVPCSSRKHDVDSQRSVVSSSDDSDSGSNTVEPSDSKSNAPEPPEAIIPLGGRCAVPFPQTTVADHSHIEWAGEGGRWTAIADAPGAASGPDQWGQFEPEQAKVGEVNVYSGPWVHHGDGVERSDVGYTDGQGVVLDQDEGQEHYEGSSYGYYDEDDEKSREGMAYNSTETGIYGQF